MTSKVCQGAGWRPGTGICGGCGRSTKNKWFCRGKKGDTDACARVWRRNHWWSAARAAAKKRDHHRCVHCGGEDRLEVNHIIPLGDGSHSQTNCRHHLDNLETLCHSCHVEVTAEQQGYQYRIIYLPHPSRPNVRVRAGRVKRKCS